MALGFIRRFLGKGLHEALGSVEITYREGFN